MYSVLSGCVITTHMFASVAYVYLETDHFNWWGKTNVYLGKGG